MIQGRNKHRIDDGPLPAIRRSYYRRTMCFAVGSNCGESERGNRGNVRLSVSGICIVLCSTKMTMLQKRANLTRKGEPDSREEPTFYCLAPSYRTNLANNSPRYQSGAPGENASDKDLQRANGSGRLLVDGSDRGTRIVEIFQRSPIRM